MEQFEVEINPDEFSAIVADKVKASRLIRDLFEEHGDNYCQLTTALERENSENGGSPEVASLEIDKVNFNPSSLAGTFRVVYDINFEYGCSDLQKTKEDQTSDWQFIVDENHSQISFKGPAYRDLRTTYEEF